MLKLLTIVGARPQFIKASALSRAIRKEYRDAIDEVILHTGQHYDNSMSEIFFEEMQIPRPRYNLDIGSETHGAQTGRMISGIEEVVLKERPRGVIVYGDTNSTLAGALAAAKLHVPVIHIEAGLRSFNKQMPEEINRIACDHVSTLLFSPTSTGIMNLEREGIVHSDSEPYTFDRQGVFHTGDLMFDNTLYFKELALKRSSILKKLGLADAGYILVTLHRPSNTDRPENLRNILLAIGEIASERGLPVILPLHPRTSKKIDELRTREHLGEILENRMLHLIPAVSFLDMIRLEEGAQVILTDSGGVQKEAWFMEKPVVILREETEWVEITGAGNGMLVGSDPGRIKSAVYNYLEHLPGDFPELFGNGQAAARILEVLTTSRWE